MNHEIQQRAGGFWYQRYCLKSYRYCLTLSFKPTIAYTEVLYDKTPKNETSLYRNAFRS